MITFRSTRLALLFTLILTLLTLRPIPAQATGSLGGCAIFPDDNPWNQDISAWPVHPNSDNFIDSIGADTTLHPDFGSDPTYGIPYVVVPEDQPLVPITYDAYG